MAAVSSLPQSRMQQKRAWLAALCVLASVLAASLVFPLTSHAAPTLSNATAYCNRDRDAGDKLFMHVEADVPAPSTTGPFVVRVLYSKQGYPSAPNDPSAKQLEYDEWFYGARRAYFEGPAEYEATYYFSAFIGTADEETSDITWEAPLQLKLTIAEKVLVPIARLGDNYNSYEMSKTKPYSLQVPRLKPGDTLELWAWYTPPETPTNWRPLTKNARPMTLRLYSPSATSTASRILARDTRKLWPIESADGAAKLLLLQYTVPAKGGGDYVLYVTPNGVRREFSWEILRGAGKFKVSILDRRIDIHRGYRWPTLYVYGRVSPGAVADFGMVRLDAKSDNGKWRSRWLNLDSKGRFETWWGIPGKTNAKVTYRVVVPSFGGCSGTTSKTYSGRGKRVN